MQHDFGVVRSYASKSEIIHENDPADRVYEVISGAVCTSRTLREGRRQIAGFYFSGDVFGLESAEQALTAEAIGDTTVRVVKKSALNALTSREVEVADRLLSQRHVSSHANKT
jgi:CRP/FNR family nitrogen fixation transcriptional regulator